MRACLPRPAAAATPTDLVDEAAAQRERRDEQLPELLRPPEAGDVVEEVGDVGGDLLVGGEDPEVLVEASRRRVVVPGADVGVATQRVALAADDERHLRVDLEIGEPVRDVDARLLELSRPLDVAQLVEARLELDEADRLLAVLGALDERADEHAVVARAVHGRLHRDDVRVADGGLREYLEARAERAVRLVHEHVAAADLVEDSAGGPICALARRGGIAGIQGSCFSSGRSSAASSRSSDRSSGLSTR